MAVRPVVRYPHPVLKAAARPVRTIDDALRALADDLVATMRSSLATVGLAAPQIGESVRLFVMDVSGHPKAPDAHGLVVVFDPEVAEAEDPEVRREGCLSVPDLTTDVRRARRIVLCGLSAEGEECRFEMEGFEARAAQHEVDHLDGLLILDRVDSASALFPRRVYQ